MDRNGHDHTITTTAELEKLYADAPYGPAVFKEIDRISPQYRKLIEAAPFCVVATCGPEGLDCSPRGDPPGFVRVLDEHTIVRHCDHVIGMLRDAGRGKPAEAPAEDLTVPAAWERYRAAREGEAQEGFSEDDFPPTRAEGVSPR